MWKIIWFLIGILVGRRIEKNYENRKSRETSTRQD